MNHQANYLDVINAIDGITAAFVARVPGVEVSTDREAAIAALEPAHREAVEQLGFDWDQCWRAEQVHGSLVVNVENAEHGSVISSADGLMTNNTGAMLGVYVADCGAVYIVDKKQKSVALVHSGAKGTAANIVAEAIRKMKDQWYSNPTDLVVVLAPCIRPPNYEIDIAGMIRKQVLDQGVPAEQFVDCGICTGEEVENYYSYRVEKGKTGRMLALLGVD